MEWKRLEFLLPCSWELRRAPHPGRTDIRTRWPDSAPLPAFVLPAVPPSPLPVFESLLQTAARSTGTITAVDTEVASVTSSAGCAILDVSVLLMLVSGLLLVAVRSFRAARRPSMWPRRRVFTAVYVGPLGWTAHAFAAPLMGAALVAFAASLRSSCCEKSLLRCVFLRAWRCGRGVCAADALDAPLHSGMRGVVWT